MIWRKSIVLAVLVALAPAAAEARFLWFGKKKIERVTVQPVLIAPPRALRPVPPPAGRATCVDARRLAAAQVYGDDAVELTLKSGARWRLYFAQSCPTLSFYDGFYYRSGMPGHLCAGRDVVILRAGGECPIASIMQTYRPKASRSQRQRRKR